MKYKEYLDTAKRHLTTCWTFYNSINWAEMPKKEELLQEKREWQNEKKRFLEEKAGLLREWIDLVNQKSEWLEKEEKILREVRDQSKNLMTRLKEIASQIEECAELFCEQEKENEKAGVLWNDIVCQSKIDVGWLEEQEEKLEKSILEVEELEEPLRMCSPHLKDVRMSLEKSVQQLEDVNYPLEKLEMQLDDIIHQLGNDAKWLGVFENAVEKVKELDAKQDDQLCVLIGRFKDNVLRLEEQEKERNGKKDLLKKNAVWLEKQLNGVDKPEESWRSDYEKKLCQIKKKQDLLDRNGKKLRTKDEKIEGKKCELDGKFKQLEKNDSLLKDIYYLSGYIFEAFIVFKIYDVGYRHVQDVYRKSGNKKFNPNEHEVDEFIKEFTEYTWVDYFPRFKIGKEGKKEIELKRKRNKINGGRMLYPDEEDFLKTQKEVYAIENHKFQDLFDLVLKNGNLRASMQDMVQPYLSLSRNSEVEKLISGWKSLLRYSDSNAWGKIEKFLNDSVLKDLLNVCQNMGKKIS